jgi:hypothetical protein
VMGRLRPPTWPPTNPYSGVVSDYVHSEADFRDLQVPSIHSEIDLRKATRIFRVAFGGRLSAMAGAPDTLKVRRERARTVRTAKKDVNPVKYHASWLASVIQRWSVGVREERVTRAMEANARDWGLLDVLAAIKKCPDDVA